MKNNVRNETPSDNQILNGIMCSAQDCNYNCPGNKCSAQSIKVGGQDAKSPDQTKCDTFEAKDE